MACRAYTFAEARDGVGTRGRRPRVPTSSSAWANVYALQAMYDSYSYMKRRFFAFFFQFLRINGDADGLHLTYPRSGASSYWYSAHFR